MTQRPAAEISWFSALCDDDYWLWAWKTILESAGCIVATSRSRPRPMGTTIYCCHQVIRWYGLIAFAGGIAPLLEKMRLLVAVRCGEMGTPACTPTAIVDTMLGGRLTVNIISSDMPGQTLDSTPRYQRTLETMQSLRFVERGAGINGWGP